jgi:phosphoribosylformylglycinamidine synthase
MIKATHAAQPRGTVVAYSDNAAILEGAFVSTWAPVQADGGNGHYRWIDRQVQHLLKVETHNHPTAIAPHPGAATGAGGEIRDEGATGRGGTPRYGLTGFTVSNLRIPGWLQPWEVLGPAHEPAPDTIASPLAIMIEGPLGGAAFNNEFGRPNLLGYFRTFETPLQADEAGGVRGFGYHKPIMLAGGVGSVSQEHQEKRNLPPGTLLAQLGGPGMRIGLGGSAASSMGVGSNSAELDFASVQRANAEMQRRAQEVIDACRSLGEANPILSIHDVGAGGLSNALPELAHGSGRGARFDLDRIPVLETGMSAAEVWCNESQERYVLAVAPERLPLLQYLCERERCPFHVVGETLAEPTLQLAAPGDLLAVDMAMSVLFGKAPRMRRHGRSRASSESPVEATGTGGLDLGSLDLADVALSVLRLPAVASKSFLITIGDRTVGGLTARDQMVGPWQVPVADCAVGMLDYRGHAGDALALGSGRRSRRWTRLPRREWRLRSRSPICWQRVRSRSATSSSRPTGWPTAARRKTTRICSRQSRRLRASALRSASAFRWVRIRCRCARDGRRAAGRWRSARRFRWWRRRMRRSWTCARRSRRSCRHESIPASSWSTWAGGESGSAPRRLRR